jgi:hypothetical protein
LKPNSRHVKCLIKTRISPIGEKTENLLAMGNNGGGTQIRTGDKGFADLCLSHLAMPPEIKWSERRDSDPRQPPWQGGALPTELLSLEVSKNSILEKFKSIDIDNIPIFYFSAKIKFINFISFYVGGGSVPLPGAKFRHA